MKKLFLLFLPLIAFSASHSQVFEQTGSIGKFKQASSFHINSAGFIFVTDRNTNQVFKLDTLGNYLKDNGGFGWDEAAFDDPSGIFSTTLNVYVCDKNNHRVQFFDKDLNYLSQLRTRNSDNEELQFGYPSSVAVNKQGDLFILDTENKRVIKFDLFGNFIQNFGGYNYGKYSLSEPGKLTTGPGNVVYVTDKNRIVLFDQYGNGIATIELTSAVSDITIIYNDVAVISDGRVFITTLEKGDYDFKEISFKDYDPETEIISSLIFNNKLYLLTSGQIDVFTESLH